VTLLYFSELTDAQHATLAVAIAALMHDFVRGPVELPGTVGYFDSEPDYDVAYATVDGDIVHELHHALHELAEVLGLPVQLRPEYIPHATLAYIDKGTRYTGPVPNGAWEADAIEVWRGDATTGEDRRIIDIPAAESLESFFASAPSPLLTDEDATEKRIAEAFRKYHETVNMGASELREWAKSPWAKKASLSRGPIDRNLTLLETPREEWTLAHARSAMRTVSFVSRMKGAEQGEPVKIDEREGPSKRDISLKNWAFDPNK
jgi:hypothetical protein